MKQKKQIIEVVEYNPLWPEEYQKESSEIARALNGQIVAIHHIGSTSVPGLKAKPVIDILLEVKNVDLLDKYDSKMKEPGYIAMGEFGIPGRRFYMKGLYQRTHHIHAFNAGSPGVHRHIAFRDYLIAHTGIAREYATLKIRCANECGNDIDIYCDGKHEFVQTYEKKALEWKAYQQAMQ